jgi:hypothetical protein
MKKLKLETIQVESYETSTVPTEVGTVQANGVTLRPCAGTGPSVCPQSFDATLCTSCESAPWCC